MSGLLKAFQKHWAQISEPYLKGILFHENATHYLLAAFIQRVTNGGAIITNEYRTGRGYSDIVVDYAGQTYVIELKLKDNMRSLDAAKTQILRYMDGLLAKEGWLVIVDRHSAKSWKKKLTWQTITEPTGEIIHVVGC
jgi:RecB family endonuclease NucS